MADTKTTVSPVSTNMEPNTAKSAAKADIIRQRVPLKKNRAHRLEGYVSPFLAEKSKIDAKFVNLQCVWRDLEQQRQLGKKAFKERQFDHKPRDKIKHRESFLNPLVTIKKETLPPEIPSGVGQLLVLETKLDENDNELTTFATKPEYRNVIHQKVDSKPVESLAAVESNKTTKKELAKKVDIPTTVTPTSPLTEKKGAKRTGCPLKLNSRNLIARSVSSSSDGSISPAQEKSAKTGNSEFTVKKVTLTKPNSPNKVSSVKSDFTTKIRLPSPDAVADEQVSKITGASVVKHNNPVTSLDSKFSDRKSCVDYDEQSPVFEGNKTTSVRILLDSSFSEDDQQISPIGLRTERKISVKSNKFSKEPKTNQRPSQSQRIQLDSSFSEDDQSGLRTESKISVKSNKFSSESKPRQRQQNIDKSSAADIEAEKVPTTGSFPVTKHVLNTEVRSKDKHNLKGKIEREENSNPSKAKELELSTVSSDISKASKHFEDPVLSSQIDVKAIRVVLESESDTEVKQTNANLETSSGKIQKIASRTEDSDISANDFKKRRSIFENTDASGTRKSKQGKSSERKQQENGGSPKRKIAAKLQNIQSNIHKIVTDIKQSKQATGHVRPSDESSHNTREELNTVAVENSPLKIPPKARNAEIPDTEKDNDKQPEVQKDLKTSAQKTSANTLVTEGSKRQEKSPVDTVTLDASGVHDRVQTLKGIRGPDGKLSDPMETDKLTVMNTKRARNAERRRKEGRSTNGYSMDLAGLPNNGTKGGKDKNETTQEIVPLKGGGQKRIVRHRSSKGSGQEPEDVATDLQKSLLTSKKVIERQLTGILDKRIESDNLVGALKRSMTKPTAREKVTAATNEIHDIIQNGVIQEENGRKVYQVRVQMGPFTGDINYTLDGETVVIEGSTTESPIFTKEIKVEFPTQGLDMELLSVHSVGAVVELNVPYLFVPSQDNGAVQNALDQYISDEVSALKREYLQPWFENNDTPAATVTENSLVMPSTLSRYMTDDDIKQAEELEIKPGEQTKDVTITNLDDSKSSRIRTLPPPPKFAPRAPPQNGLESEEDKLSVENSKISKRHRRNTSLSSNAAVSSANAINHNNNNVNSSQHSPPSVAQSPGDHTEVFVYGSNSLTRPTGTKSHRTRRNRNSMTQVNQEISHNGNIENGYVGSRNSVGDSIDKNTLTGSSKQSVPDIQVTEASSSGDE